MLSGESTDLLEISTEELDEKDNDGLSDMRDNDRVNKRAKNIKNEQNRTYDII